jgi:gliding motility-associated-like protein
MYNLSVVNDTNSCKGTASINVVVNTPDIPKVISPTLICLNSQPAPLTATGDNLLWYTAQGTTGDTAAPVPATNWPNNFTYFVTQAIGNCESPKAEIDVEIKRCCDGNIFIPTAFSPNGDGLNDKFRPIADYGYSINNMAVYNRWGQVVYSGQHGVWDGNQDGRPAEMGTYFYIITFGCSIGGTTVRKGDVILLR